MTVKNINCFRQNQSESAIEFESDSLRYHNDSTFPLYVGKEVVYLAMGIVYHINVFARINFMLIRAQGRSRAFWLMFLYARSETP